MSSRTCLLSLVLILLISSCAPAPQRAAPPPPLADPNLATAVVILAGQAPTPVEHYAHQIFGLLGLTVRAVPAASLVADDVPPPAANQRTGWFMTFQAAQQLSPAALSLLDQRTRAGAKGFVVEVNGSLGELAALTDGKVKRAGELPAGTLSISRFSNLVPELTQELSEVEFGHGMPWPGMYLEYTPDDSIVPVIRVTGEKGQTDGLARLLAVKRGEGTLLLQAANPDPNIVERPLRELLAGGRSFDQLYVEAMLEAVPPVLFAKFLAGDAAWHNPRRLANFTLDGAPLTQPFWNQSYTRQLYGRLLEHARSSNFHVTVAAVPDHLRFRSEEVTALFRANPDRLSVAVRGRADACPAFPTELTDRELLAGLLDVRQAMDAFRSRSGVPYARVMVFPCDDFASRDLAALKRWNFLAVSNGADPRDAGVPPWDFQLGRVAEYPGGVPLVSRQLVTSTAAALDFALDRPAIVFEHPAFFEPSAAAFDEWAARINATPDVTWASLGEVLQRHVWQKRNRDGSFSARLFFAEAILENPSELARSYQVELPADDAVPVESVLVDGRSVSFQVKDGAVRFVVNVNPGTERSVQVRYREPEPSEY